MKTSTKRALWIGSGIATAAAVVGGVALMASKPAAAATGGPTALPMNPPHTKTLDVIAGASNAQISAGDTLVLQVPTGTTFTSDLSVDNNVQAALGQATVSLPPSVVGAGTHTISGTFGTTSNTGTSYISFTITLTVTP